MCTLAAIGVYNNFATRKARVAMRTANHKLARGIDVVFDVTLVEKGFNFGSMDALVYHTRNEYLLHVFLYARLHLAVGLLLRTSPSSTDKLVVLGAHHNGVDALCHIVVVIFYSHLAL